MIPNRTIMQGDVIERLKEIPDETIACVITSPPYWNQRNYNMEKQWGHETTFFEYLDKLKAMMEECRRIIRPSGTIWVNLGDTYNGGKAGNPNGTGRGAKRKHAINKASVNKKPVSAIRRKSKCGIPERFYTNCIDSGFVARNHIVWNKPNNMPDSVKDRFTTCWESVFFFAKNERYYFDLDAVRETPKTDWTRHATGNRANNADLNNRNFMPVLSPEDFGQMTLDRPIREKYAADPNSNAARLHRDRPGNPNKQDSTLMADGKPNPKYAGFNARWKQRKSVLTEAASKGMNSRGASRGCYPDGTPVAHPNGKNPGDCWAITTKPLKESHVAPFPPELPERVIRCATKEGDVVLDPFLGSGTVAIVAERLNRNWIGIELNEEYVKMARRRLGNPLV